MAVVVGTPGNAILLNGVFASRQSGDWRSRDGNQSASCVTMCTSTDGASRRKRWMAVMYKYFLQPSTAERPKMTWVTCFSRTNAAVAEDTSLPVNFKTFAPRLSEN